MKKNNKGFMLAETVVAGTVVLTSMVVLYSTFNRIYSLYKEKMNYYNVDAIYATKEVVHGFMKEDFGEVINTIFEGSTYFKLIDKNNCYSTIDGKVIINENFCKRLNEVYGVNNIIVTEYDKTTLEKVMNDITLNQSFKDYINYVIGYYGVSNHDTKYSYLVLTEIKDGSNYYYANLGIG